MYDVADLYKAECTIPIAFNVVKKIQDDGTADFADIAGITRRAVRDRIKELRLPEQMAHDLAVLLVGDREQPDDGEFWADVVQLWDEKQHSVVGGMNYSDDAADYSVESPDRPC